MRTRLDEARGAWLWFGVAPVALATAVFAAGWVWPGVLLYAAVGARCFVHAARPVVVTLPLLERVEQRAAAELGAALRLVEGRLRDVQQAIERDRALFGASVPPEALQVAREALMARRLALLRQVRAAHAHAVGCAALEALPSAPAGEVWVEEQAARLEVNRSLAAALQGAGSR